MTTFDPKRPGYGGSPRDTLAGVATPSGRSPSVFRSITHPGSPQPSPSSSSRSAKGYETFAHFSKSPTSTLPVDYDGSYFSASPPDAISTGAVDGRQAAVPRTLWLGNRTLTAQADVLRKACSALRGLPLDEYARREQLHKVRQALEWLDPVRTCVHAHDACDLLQRDDNDLMELMDPAWIPAPLDDGARNAALKNLVAACLGLLDELAAPASLTDDAALHTLQSQLQALSALSNLEQAHAQELMMPLHQLGRAVESLAAGGALNAVQAQEALDVLSGHAQGAALAEPGSPRAASPELFGGLLRPTARLSESRLREQLDALSGFQDQVLAHQSQLGQLLDALTAEDVTPSQQSHQASLRGTEAEPVPSTSLADERVDHQALLDELTRDAAAMADSVMGLAVHDRNAGEPAANLPSSPTARSEGMDIKLELASPRLQQLHELERDGFFDASSHVAKSGKDAGIFVSPSDVDDVFRKNFGDGLPPSIQAAGQALQVEYGKKFQRSFVSASVYRCYGDLPRKPISDGVQTLAREIQRILLERPNSEPMPIGEIKTALAAKLKKPVGHGEFRDVMDLMVQKGVVEKDRTITRNRWGTTLRAKLTDVVDLVRDLELQPMTKALLKAVLDYQERAGHSAAQQPSHEAPQVPTINDLRALLPVDLRSCSEHMFYSTIHAYYGCEVKSTPKSLESARPARRHAAESAMEKELISLLTDRGPLTLLKARAALAEKLHLSELSTRSVERMLKSLMEIEKKGSLYHLAGDTPVTTVQVKVRGKPEKLLTLLQKNMPGFPGGIVSKKMMTHFCEKEGLKITGSKFMANTESFFSVVDSDEAAAVVASEAFKQSEFKDIKHRPGDVFYRLRTEVLDDQYTQQEKLRESLREWVSERDQNEVFFFKDARKKLGAPVRLRGHFYDLANKGVLVKLERGYKRAPLPGESTEEVVIDPAPKSGVGRKRKHVPAPIGESATGEAVSMGPAALKALRSHINRALRNLAFDKAHGGLDNSREDIEDLLARVRLPGAAVPADLRDRVTQGLEALGWTDFAQPVTASAGGGAAPALEARESALSGPLAKRRKANTRAATQDT